MAEQGNEGTPGTFEVSRDPFSISTGELNSTELRSMLDNFLSPIGENIAKIESNSLESKDINKNQLEELKTINIVLDDIKNYINISNENIKDVKNNFNINQIKNVLDSAITKGLQKIQSNVSDKTENILQNQLSKISQNISKTGSSTGPSLDITSLQSALDNLSVKIERMSNKSFSEKNNKIFSDFKLNDDINLDNLEDSAKKVLGKNFEYEIDSARKKLISLVSQGLDSSKAEKFKKKLEEIGKEPAENMKDLHDQMKKIVLVQKQMNEQQKDLSDEILTGSEKLKTAFSKVSSFFNFISFTELLDSVKTLQTGLRRTSTYLYGIYSQSKDIENVLHRQSNVIADISDNFLSNQQIVQTMNTLYQKGIHSFEKQDSLLKSSAANAQHLGISFEELVDHTSDMTFNLKLTASDSKYLAYNISSISRSLDLSAKQIINIQSNFKGVFENLRRFTDMTSSSISDVTKMAASIEKIQGNNETYSKILSGFTGGIQGIQSLQSENAVLFGQMASQLSNLGVQSTAIFTGMVSDTDKINKAFANVIESIVLKGEAFEKAGYKENEINTLLQLQYKITYNEAKRLSKANDEYTKSYTDKIKDLKKEIENIQKSSVLPEDMKETKIASIQDTMSALFSGINQDVSSLSDQILETNLNASGEFKIDKDLASKLQMSIGEILKNKELLPEGFLPKGFDISKIENISSLLNNKELNDSQTKKLLEGLSEFNKISKDYMQEDSKKLSDTATSSLEDGLAKGRNKLIKDFNNATNIFADAVDQFAKSIVYFGSIIGIAMLIPKLFPYLPRMPRIPKFKAPKAPKVGEVVKPSKTNIQKASRRLRASGQSSKIRPRQRPLRRSSMNIVNETSKKSFTGRIKNIFSKEGFVGKSFSRIGNFFSKEGFVGKSFSRIGNIFSKEGFLGKRFIGIKDFFKNLKISNIFKPISDFASKFPKIMKFLKVGSKALTWVYMIGKSIWGFFNAAEILGMDPSKLTFSDKIYAMIGSFAESILDVIIGLPSFIGRVIATPIDWIVKNITGYDLNLTSIFDKIDSFVDSIDTHIAQFLQNLRDLIPESMQWLSNLVFGKTPEQKMKEEEEKKQKELEKNKKKTEQANNAYMKHWGGEEQMKRIEEQKKINAELKEKRKKRDLEQQMQQSLQKKAEQSPTKTVKENITQSISDSVKKGSTVEEKVKDFEVKEKSPKIIDFSDIKVIKGEPLSVNSDSTPNPDTTLSGIKSVIPAVGQSQVDSSILNDVASDVDNSSEIEALSYLGSTGDRTVYVLSEILKALTRPVNNTNQRSLPGTTDLAKANPNTAFSSTQGSHFGQDTASWQYNQFQTSGGINENMAT